MSLMLNALKQIEAKQTQNVTRKASDPVEPSMPPAGAEPDGPIDSPPAIPAEVPPSISLEDFTLPASLDAIIDQLQLFAPEANSAGDLESKFGDAESEAASLEAANLHVTNTVAANLDAPDLDAAEPPITRPVAYDPYAATAEQIIRQLPRDRSQILLFTSPADGQGKTMTLARLAPRLAQCMEGNLLVVDANFRNPDMARCLAVAPTCRLSDVLGGAADWATAVQKSQHDGVSLLPGGSDAQVCSPVRNLQGVSQIFRELAGHYDLVVVDTSSLAHHGTVQLAAICDGVYLVVRLGEGSPRMLCEAAHVLQSNGGRLMGCVAIGAGGSGLPDTVA